MRSGSTTYKGVVYNPNGATNWNQGYIKFDGVGTFNGMNPQH